MSYIKLISFPEGKTVCELNNGIIYKNQKIRMERKNRCTKCSKVTNMWWTSLHPNSCKKSFTNVLSNYQGSTHWCFWLDMGRIFFFLICCGVLSEVKKCFFMSPTKCHQNDNIVTCYFAQNSGILITEDKLLPINYGL